MRFKKKLGLLGLMILSSLSLSKISQSNMLELPVDCEFGKTCFIQKYVDAAAGENYKDYKCGLLTNDTHRGTDFRLMDYEALAAGVNVLAAMDGEVLETRDYLPDVNVALVGEEAVLSRGLGNLVLIKHPNGYRTVYAHLKRHSVKVKAGDIVKAGDVIGQIGMSGLTDYPHVHFELYKDKTHIDPFTGLPAFGTCGEVKESLWKEELPYKPTHLIRLGIYTERLNRHAMEHKLYETPRMTPKSKGMILNAYVAGVRAGDVFRVKLWQGDNPKPFFNKSGSYKNDRAFAIISGGKGDLGRPWPVGTYRAELTYSRNVNGQLQTLFQESATTEIKDYH